MPAATRLLLANQHAQQVPASLQRFSAGDVFLHQWATQRATRPAQLLEQAQGTCLQDRLLKREQAA
jgi:hypothetical protein